MTTFLYNFLTYFSPLSLFRKIREGLWHHFAVCVSLCFCSSICVPSLLWVLHVPHITLFTLPLCSNISTVCRMRSPESLPMDTTLYPKRHWTWEYVSYAGWLYRKLKRYAHLWRVCLWFTRWPGCPDKLTHLILSGTTKGTSVQTLYNNIHQHLFLVTVYIYHLICRYMTLIALQNKGINGFNIYIMLWISGPPLWSSGQSSWLHIRWPGFDSRHYQKKKVMGLERDPLSLVSTTEELLNRKVATPV
jgi:hypothetical protein